jgi:sterol desaturase/sphingolipid hydroxylase (fatty acid hydroxylase superfamily)
MSWQIASPLIIVGTAFAFIGLERLFPYDRGQKIFRKGFFVDLIGYGLFQSYVLGLAINAIIRALLSWAGAPDGFHLVTGWPVGAQVFFFFVTHDFYIYWFHRWQHHSKYLWRIHEAHHSVPDVDWLAGTRSHSLEILINQTIEFAPIALLGAAPEVAIIKATLDAVWGMYIHSNVGARSGRLQRVINGPEMHRWHHARELAERNANFGTKLAIWDWVFGTAYLPATKPKAYGLADGDAYPEGYVGQHIAAFRPFARRDAALDPDLAVRTPRTETS